MRTKILTTVLSLGFGMSVTAQVSTPGGNTAILNSNPSPLGLLNLDGSSWYQSYPTLRGFSMGNEPGLNYTPGVNFVDLKLNRIPWFGGTPILDNTFLINNYGDASFGMSAMNYTRLSVKGNFFVGHATNSGIRFTDNRMTFANSTSNDYLFRATTDFFSAGGVDLLRLRSNQKSTFYGQLGVGVDPGFFGLEILTDAGVQGRLKVGNNPNYPLNWNPNSSNTGDFRAWQGSFAEHRALYGEALGDPESLSFPIGVEGTTYTTCRDVNWYSAYGVIGRALNANLNFGVYGSTPSDAEICEGGRVNYAIYGDGIDYGYGTYHAGYFNGDVTVTGAFHHTSDKKLKKNIAKFDYPAMTIVSKLNPVSYEFKTEDPALKGFQLPSGKRYGFIAQELQQVLPQLVKQTTHPAQIDREGNLIREKIDYLSVNYVEIIPILTKAIQEQDAKIKELQNQLTEVLDLLQTEQSQKRYQNQQEFDNNLNFFNASNMNLIPNPSSGKFTIDISNIQPGQYTLEIISITGSVLNKIELTTNGSTLSHDFYGGSLSKGQYQVRLVRDSQLIASKRLILQ